MDHLNARGVICDQAVGGKLSNDIKRHIVEDCFHLSYASEEGGAPVTNGHLHQVALIQHSSGTTDVQKAVALTHAQLIAQVEVYGETIGIGKKDVIASWLPLYHDMGLLTALIGPIVWGCSVIACDPREWVYNPGKILEMIHDHKATLTWWPNFTFPYLARSISDEKKPCMTCRASGWS